MLNFSDRMANPKEARPVGIPLAHLYQYQFVSELPDEDQRQNLLQEIDRNQKQLQQLDHDAQHVWLGLVVFNSDPDVSGGQALVKIGFARRNEVQGASGPSETMVLVHRFLERPDPLEGARTAQAIIRSAAQSGFIVIDIMLLGLALRDAEPGGESGEDDFIRRLAKGETPRGWRPMWERPADAGES